jgi:hypothetical protein
MYRATVDSHWILAKDGQPDHRIPVPLGHDGGGQGDSSLNPGQRDAT